MNYEALIPRLGEVIDIRQDTPDIKTFRVVPVGGEPLFRHVPGQCAMLSMPGVGEAMFSITSADTEDGYKDFSIKKCGCFTDYLHSIEVGQQLTIRGPYGNGFPVDTDFVGKDLVFVAGGVGFAPLHSIIDYCIRHREKYGAIDVVYGARTPRDFVAVDDIYNNWPAVDDLRVYLTIDRPFDGWDGHVGFVPNYASELEFDRSKTVILCGPPVMIHFTLDGLLKQGFAKEQIYTTMEMRMKCGIGKCGRCNIGDKYVCKDGPVFRMDQLEYLPDEY